MTLPLEGVRVADFSWVVAGPFCTQFLALMGAEVIKIESGVHTDLLRRIPPFVKDIPGTERGGLWQTLNLGKKSVTLDLARPEAQELAVEIVRGSDIVIENFSFGQMEKFSLTYERFKAVKPDIIMVTSSGLGRSGPYRDYVTFGPPMTAYTGLASITGRDGRQPERGIGGLWSDHQAGLTSLFGLLLALEHRDRTGEGQLVEYSMAEAVAGQLPEAFIRYGCTGEAPGPIGSRDPAAAPHNIYPARGHDQWIAIAILEDEDWLTFRGFLPEPGWLMDPALESLEGRLRAQTEIDAVIREWTRDHDPKELAAQLQAAGIAAGHVAHVEDVVGDDLLAARDFFLVPDHPEVGPLVHSGMPWAMPSLAGAPVEHAPLLGEHNWEVLVDWLGLSPERFAELVALGAIA
jgi:crotonobetainyl-CoA:carnitine CoA-transferase CaiB-like acyl-CoA transferase